MYQIIKSLSATQNGSNNSKDNSDICNASHQLDQIGATTPTANQLSNEVSRSSSDVVDDLISLARAGCATRKQWANADAAAVVASFANNNNNNLHRDRATIRRKQHNQHQLRRGDNSITRSRSRRRRSSRGKSNQRHH